MGAVLDSASGCRCMGGLGTDLQREARLFWENRLDDVDGVLRAALLPRARRTWESGIPVHGERDVALGAFVEPLARIFPEARFLFVAMDAMECVERMSRWHADVVGNFYREAADQPPLSPAARANADRLPAEKDMYDYGRPRPLPGDPWHDRWPSMTHREMLCWYWNAWNLRILDSLERLPADRRRILDASAPDFLEQVREAAQFLDLVIDEDVAAEEAARQDIEKRILPPVVRAGIPAGESGPCWDICATGMRRLGYPASPDVMRAAADRRRRDAALNLEIRFLRDECSELRRLVRMLLAESPAWREEMAQTKESFEAQWTELPEGRALASDPAFTAGMIREVEESTALPAAWFAGKDILDAGCGNGRWSLALSTMGARVTAVDQSARGVEETKRLCAAFPDFRALRADLLEPAPFAPESFDMVWSFGVLHHTGAAFAAFRHLVPLIRPGGALFLMLYGEPETAADCAEINAYARHRGSLAGMSLPERLEWCRGHFPPEEVHGWFDALSPAVNDLFRFAEVRAWLRGAGFTDIRRTRASRFLHVMAWKPAGESRS